MADRHRPRSIDHHTPGSYPAKPTTYAFFSFHSLDLFTRMGPEPSIKAQGQISEGRGHMQITNFTFESNQTPRESPSAHL